MSEQLYDFQRDGIAWLVDTTSRYGTAYLADYMGLGKAQPLDAQILTPTGWRSMGEIQVGDFVIGADGQPTRVSAVHEHGVKPVFRVVFSDGSSTRCCDDHLWAYDSAHGRKVRRPSRVAPLRLLRNNLKYGGGRCRKHFIPLTAPVQFTEQRLPLDPYLLGALLGDGGIKYHVNFTSADAGVLAEVAQAVPAGTALKKQIGRYQYGITSPRRGSPNAVLHALKTLGLFGRGSDDKFIPEPYLFASPADREALLQGLLDTDGYVARHCGTVQFSSNSRALVDGVVHLVRSLGGVARVSTKTSASGKPHHTATLALPMGIRPFRLSRKAVRCVPRTKYLPARAIDRVEPVAPAEVKCITVEAADGLYLTDDFIVTHNSVQAINAADRLGIDFVGVICPAIATEDWARKFAVWSDYGRAVHVGTHATPIAPAGLPKRAC